MLSNKEEKQILENIFDALDRLFDNQCMVSDLHSLLYASELALKSMNSSVELGDYIDNLQKIIRIESSSEIQRILALKITDSLRSKLNELLPIQ